MNGDRVLVYHTGSLGDTLVAVPALWAVRENYPHAHIAMLCHEQPGRPLVQPRDVLDGSGLIDEYIVYPMGMPLTKAWWLLRQLRSRKFGSLIYLVSSAIDARRVRRDMLFFRFAGTRRQIGAHGICQPPATHPDTPMSAVPQVAEALLARLRADGLQTPPIGLGRLDVGIGERERKNVERWLSELPNDGGRRRFALGLGSNMPCKIWPPERYMEVAKHLVDEYDLWPVIFGSSAERDTAIEFVRELGRGHVAAGALGVRDSMAAMEGCVLFLGNDTGTMHMAAASGVRCIVPFSSRDAPGKWYPYGEGHIVIRTPVQCEGCMLVRCGEQEMRCILAITVERVLQACRQALGDED